MGDQVKKSTYPRRSFLRLAGASAAFTAFGGLSGCSPREAGPMVVEVPIESIPMGGRLRILYGETPVELIRGADGVEARSLWCTHTGCEVKWKEDQQIYLCACHDGRFNAAGEVLAGPPPRALSKIPISVSESVVLVGEST